MKATIQQFTFGARIELEFDGMRVKRNVTCLADNAQDAAERMKRQVRPLWPGWTITFLTPPAEVKS
jgi:hypothetical protein